MNCGDPIINLIPANHDQITLIIINNNNQPQLPLGPDALCNNQAVQRYLVALESKGQLHYIRANMTTLCRKAT